MAQQWQAVLQFAAHVADECPASWRRPFVRQVSFRENNLALNHTPTSSSSQSIYQGLWLVSGQWVPLSFLSVE